MGKRVYVSEEESDGAFEEIEELNQTYQSMREGLERARLEVEELEDDLRILSREVEEDEVALEKFIEENREVLIL